jgi:hypothetical protein
MIATVKAEFIEPMLLLRTDALPDDAARWEYQLKFDGYRAIAFKAAGKVHLRSRNDNDFSHAMRSNSTAPISIVSLIPAEHRLLPAGRLDVDHNDATLAGDDRPHHIIDGKRFALGHFTTLYAIAPEPREPAGPSRPANQCRRKPGYYVISTCGEASSARPDAHCEELCTAGTLLLLGADTAFEGQGATRGQRSPA